jgi:seryl-tRNA synthetase
MSSDFDKGQLDLVHEININRERVNACGEGVRRQFLEYERLKKEQRAQAELYARALRERNELEAALTKATRLADRTAALEAEVKAVRADRDAINLAYRNAQAAVFRAAAGRDELIHDILNGAPRKQLRDLAKRLRAMC